MILSNLNLFFLFFKKDELNTFYYFQMNVFLFILFVFFILGAISIIVFISDQDIFYLSFSLLIFLLLFIFEIPSIFFVYNIYLLETKLLAIIIHLLWGMSTFLLIENIKYIPRKVRKWHSFIVVIVFGILFNVVSAILSLNFIIPSLSLIDFVVNFIIIAFGGMIMLCIQIHLDYTMQLKKSIKKKK